MKTKIILSTVLASFLLLAGCSSKDEVAVADAIIPTAQECIVEGEDAASWVCLGENIDGYYTATGFSANSKAGHGYTIDNARTDAYGKLAIMIESNIKTKVTKFLGTTGLDKSETVDVSYEKITKQTASSTIQDAKVLRYWEHPENGSIYVMLGVDEKNVFSTAKSVITSSFRNEDAAWQQYRMKNAAEELDKEFPTL